MAQGAARGMARERGQNYVTLARSAADTWSGPGIPTADARRGPGPGRRRRQDGEQRRTGKQAKQLTIQ